MPYANAHAARVQDGIVTQVIVIPYLDDDDEKITEYCNALGLEGTWIDTSYTGSRRGKFAGITDIYDVENDTFVAANNDPAPERPEDV